MLDPQRRRAEHDTQAMRLFLEENWPTCVVLGNDNHRAASVAPNGRGERRARRRLSLALYLHLRPTTRSTQRGKRKFQRIASSCSYLLIKPRMSREQRRFAVASRYQRDARFSTSHTSPLQKRTRTRVPNREELRDTTGWASTPHQRVP